MTPSIDVRALRYFLAVTEHSGYSRAALDLRVSQPAVSRQIQGLERTLKTRLFRREGHSFYLTESGEALAREARGIVGAIDRLEDQVGEASRVPSGRLSIGMPIAAGESLLPEVLHSYRRQYPSVFLHVVQGYTTYLADSLAAGELDVAIVYGRPRQRELELTSIVEFDLGLVAPSLEILGKTDLVSNKKTVGIRDLFTLPMILPSRAEMLREVVEQAWQNMPDQPNVIMEVDSLSLAKELVQRGHGYTLLAYGAVRKEIQSGALRFFPIKSPTIPWLMSLATRKGSHQTSAALAFAREATKSIGGSAQTAGWRGHLVGDMSA